MGGDKQTTVMVLKVDLQCHKCYKKIKKVLCKFPQIQDQVYDEKANTVTIKVVCCSPDCIREKIICKGGDTIKSIDIKLPDIPKPKPPVKDAEPKPDKTKEAATKPEKPKEAAPKPEKPKDAAPKPDPQPPKEKPKPAPPPAVPAPAPTPAPAPAPTPAPLPVPVPVGYPPVPFASCCPECREGRPGGPCFYGWVPAGPPPCYQYDGYCGRPVYDSYGGGRSYCVNRCDYFSEENTGACAIM